jgi:nitrate/nitrite-specific signal transduction histidine kinase
MDRKKFLLGMTALGLAGLGINFSSPTGYDRNRKLAAAAARKLEGELHDGAMQLLLMVDAQVDELRRRAEADLPIGGEELARIQSALGEAMREMREVMLRLRAEHAGIPVEARSEGPQTTFRLLQGM